MKKSIIFLLLFFSINIMYAEVLQVNFRQGSSLLEQSEQQKINSLFEQVDINSLESINIHSNTSPEGGVYLNDTLSFSRATNVMNYLKQEFGFEDSFFECSSSLVDWDYFERLVYLYDVPFKSKILEFISRRDMDALKRFNSGELYAYIYKYIYPCLRSCSLELIAKDYIVEYQVVNIYSQYSVVTSPVLAIKTNLLFDLASLINFEIEVPLSRRFSLAAEAIFPWWSSETNDFTLELRAFHLGLNYWLFHKQDRPIMTGLSLGVFGGYGLYDFQMFTQKGIQGRFFDVSLAVGYAHSITKNLRMEYQLGLGYLRTKYEKYTDTKSTPYGNIKVVSYPWENHIYNWFGPTRARVSLVWMINKIR